MFELSIQGTTRSKKAAQVLKSVTFITDRLIANEFILKDDREVVEYGLESIKNNLISVGIILAVGAYFDNFIHNLVLWLLVFLLRKNAGGFHAKTKVGCLISSSGIIIINYMLYYKIQLSRVLYIALAFFWSSLIFIICPVENLAKPLDSVEFKVYRKRTKLIISFEILLFILAMLINVDWLSNNITISFSIVGTLSLIGKLKIFLHSRIVSSNNGMNNTNEN